MMFLSLAVQVLMVVPTYAFLIPGGMAKANGCLYPERTADGITVRNCGSDEQCSLGYSCNTTLSKCCLNQACPPNFQEKTTAGKTKSCSETELCSQNFKCFDGICCSYMDSLLDKNPIVTGVNAAKKGTCPSPQTMAVGLCFNIDNTMRCQAHTHCQGEQLCCQSGCGKICTKPETPETQCQKEFKMAAVQLLSKTDTCTPVYVPRCDNNGKYLRKQCLDMHGICWCVHDNGTRIVGSEVRGNPDCSTATKPGRCPNLFSMTLIDDGCWSDDNCTGPDKCCFNGLGYQCVPPDGLLNTERDKRSVPTDNGCPVGKQMKCCDMDLCTHAICPIDPGATCRVNPCNDCSVEFYDNMNRKIDSCYEGMSKCDVLRINALNIATPSLMWIDTTNPPWMRSSSVQFLGEVNLYWIDTTNPEFLRPTSAYGAASDASSGMQDRLTLMDVAFLLQKITGDNKSNKFQNTLGAVEHSPHFGIGASVCPALVPGMFGTCVQACNNDSDCGSTKQCCSNGCGQTCQDPVQVTSTEVCKLPPVTGDCIISGQTVKRYYYDEASKQCREFLYKEGCDGNANNFLTAQACENGCKSVLPEHCLLDPDPGNCEGYIPMWFFNVTSNMCEQFVYGGCHGNKNMFSTEEQCGVSCTVPKGCTGLECSENAVCLNDRCVSKSVFEEIGLYIPECKDGQFLEEQCSGTFCWCVNTATGDYVENTMRIGHAPCTGNGSLIDTHKPVCQNGNTPSPCIGACQGAVCAGDPDARCIPDPCNNCSVTFVMQNYMPASCKKLDKCKSEKPDQVVIGNRITGLRCSNPQMRYIYNTGTKTCEGFLYSSCDGPDKYFTSSYDCLEQCSGSMCPGSQPKTCENTCMSASCPNFPGSLCQVDLCSCKPMFYDPVTRQQINCDSVFPVCQLQRARMYYRMVNHMQDNTENYFPVCDENGDFLPEQCSQNRNKCWCVDGTGNKLSESNNPCIKMITTAAKVSFRFMIDYDMYAKGKEQKLERLILEKLKQLSPKFEKLVKTIRIQRGSILVDVELEASSAEMSNEVSSHANLLESEVRNNFSVSMDGTLLTADSNMADTAMTFKAEDGTDPTRLNSGTIKQRTVIIIIIVICGVLLVIIVIIIICAKRRSQRREKANFDTVENDHRPNSLYFKNDACDLKEGVHSDKTNEKFDDVKLEEVDENGDQKNNEKFGIDD